MATSQTQLTSLQQGDPKAQRELYDLYKTKVMGICVRYTKDNDEADDIFQESFIKIFNHIQELREVGNLEQWIRKITVNTAINYYHKNKKHSHAVEKNGVHYQSDDYELILGNFSNEIIIEIINHLPEGYRMVFNLNVVEGFSHAEIAEALHITEATSRSQLTKAKQTLRHKLRALGIIKFEKYGS
jgi:RNA polymerase sigma factor (sigma-70 family)